MSLHIIRMELKISVYSRGHGSHKHFVITTVFLLADSDVDSLFIAILLLLIIRLCSAVECFAAWASNPRQHLHFYVWKIVILA